MAEFLVKAQDSTAQESDGKWRAGRIVVVMPDGHEWGVKEGLPVFYLIKVLGVTVEDAKQYISDWNHAITYNKDVHQQSTDGYRYTLTSSAVAAGGKGSLTLAKVQNFFDKWNASIQSNTSSSVTFDVSIYGLATSSGFWGKNTSAITFNETSYNETTGEHIIEVITPEITDTQIEQNCLVNGVEYIAPRSFKVTRAVRQAMRDDIEQAFSRLMVERRRWYVTAAGMNALANNGGVMTVTPTQFANNIRDGYLD